MKVNPLPENVRALLPRLGLESADIMRMEPMPGGLSDGQLYRVWLRHGNGPGREPTRVIKYAEPLAGWLGETSGDTRIREAQLAAHGLFAELPRGIETATLAVAFRGRREHPAGAALLMRDVRPFLVRDPLRMPPGTIPADATMLIDRLARMHAHFWNDPRLDDPTLGLMSPERALLVTGPQGVAARLARGDMLPYLSLAHASWQDFFTLAGDGAAERFQAIIAEPEHILRALARLPRTLVHGDIWGPNMGWRPKAHGGWKLLLLDWALALAGPATYDLLWYLGMWLAVDTTRVMALYRARLARALRMRGLSLDDATWLALADAAYLRTVLTCGEGMARAALAAPAGIARQSALRRLRWWIARALAAADRLERWA